MAIRRILNEQPAIGLVVFGVVMAGAAVMFLSSGRTADRPDVPKFYFTSDDGATHVLRDMTLVPPHASESGELVRAFLFRSRQGGEPFVGYLMKYTPAAAERLRPGEADIDLHMQLLESVRPAEMLFKKPGAGQPWVAGDSAAAAALKAVKGSDGAPAAAVLPPS